MSGGKSNSEKEDKRDREERKVRAGGRENVEMRGVDYSGWTQHQLGSDQRGGVHVHPAVTVSVL